MLLHKFFSYLVKNQVIFALTILALGWVLFLIKDIIVSIFISYIIMSSILPAVDYLRRHKFPKILAVLIPYLGILTAIFLLVLPLAPFVISQIQSLVVSFPQYLDKSATSLGVTIDAKQVQNYLGSEAELISKNAFDLTTKLFGGLFSVFTVFIVSFYLIMYYDSFKKFVAGLFHSNEREKVIKILDHVNDKLGAWMRGQVALSFFIGLLSWICLSILGLPFALPLSLLAGLLEVVPTLGPILSAIPAVIVAFTISPTMGLTVALVYVLIQAIENHVLVPKVMQRAVGLNPVVVILAITIGAHLMGLAGALLAIPFISFLIVIFQGIEEIK